MNWLVSVSAVAALLSAVAAFFAVLQASRNFQAGAELQAFLVLTERYESIMRELPQAARLTEEWSNDVDDDLAIRLRYLNLCSEEFYLKEKKLLSETVWDIWEADMRATLASPPYREAWLRLRPQFRSYTAFRTFVEAAAGDT